MNFQAAHLDASKDVLILDSNFPNFSTVVGLTRVATSTGISAIMDWVKLLR
jgi:hypothetical protein